MFLPLFSRRRPARVAWFLATILLTETLRSRHSGGMFEEALELPQPRRKQRDCLCCAKTFDSAWAGERICPRCKGSATWREDLAKNGANQARYQGRNRLRDVP
jgi:uncharacterized paraquat-inducible protein A